MGSFEEDSKMDSSVAEDDSAKALSANNKAVVPARTGSDFLHSNDLVEEGDTVIIYVNFGTAYSIVVKRGRTMNMKYGSLRHEYLIGRRYGSRVSATAGYVYVLRPNPELWTITLPRRTQILYGPDCSLILMLLDIRPGSVICESGTGSGSLSHALAVALAPSGHLYTHDIDESRVKNVEEELKLHGLDEVTTCIHRNVCEDGFFVENACDGVFLDLPAPWEVIEHAKRSLSRARGGRLVSFSPCIEQIQKACVEIRRQGFVQVETIELVPRKLKVIETGRESLEDFNKTNAAPTEGNDNGIEGRGSKRRRLEGGRAAMGGRCSRGVIAYPHSQPTHTGYIISATLLPSPVN